MALGLVEKFRSVFEGDPGIRMVAGDPVLSAELLLLFRMILADGVVTTQEMEVFRRICSQGFGIPEESIDGVIEYLNDFGYETNGGQAIAMFRELEPERRMLLGRHMMDIAKADMKLVDNEVKLMRRTLEMLGLRADELTTHAG